MATTNLLVTQINLQHCKEASSLMSHLINKEPTTVALIQEPWVFKNYIRGLSTKGGRLFCDSKCDRPRTCIVSGASVQARLLEQFTSQDITAVQTTIDMGGQTRELVLGSAYLPYDASEPPPSKEVVSLIQYCSNNKLPLILGCDANSHHPCWGSIDSNERGNALLEYLVTTDLTILNKGTKPTFVVTKRQAVIDITLASSDVAPFVTEWRVSDEESLSDHRYIKFRIQSGTQITPLWRNPRATQWEAFYADLEQAHGGRLRNIWTTDDIENEVTVLQQHLKTSYENNCKERKTHTGRGARWWYPELERMRKKCRKNIRKARRNQLDWDSVREERKIYKKTIRQSKRDSWHRFCNSVAGPRPAARLFKVLGKDQEVYIDNITLSDGSNSRDTGEVLRYLLDTHFPGNTPYKNDNNISSHNQHASPENWNMAKRIVTEERVRWAVSLFAPYKSPGIDGIFPALLQKGLDILIDTLVKIFRACVAYGYIPVQWRTSRVVFVPKPGRMDYTLVKSFRPISLMSFLLKTVERLVDRYIRDDTLTRYPLHSNQHAYQAGKSTDSALHILVGKIEKALNNNEYALGVFLDIEGAFNNASPSSLLHVLRARRVSSTIVRWIDSMLSSRIARANSGDINIEVHLTKGFPQGGVLSALMWILIADGLLLALNSVGYFAQGFADDFSALVAGRNLRTVCEVMQVALKRIEKWCVDHGLSVNPKKTEMVLFTRKRILTGMRPILFFGKELTRTDQVKHLGIVLDSKLTWKEHLQSKCKKAVALFWQCRRIVGKTWGITPKIAHWIYITIIRPMLTHGAVVWWPRVELAVARTLLSSLQRLACLAITGAIRTTPTAAMEMLTGLLPLDIHIKQVAMSTCYRLKSNINWKHTYDPKSHTHVLDWMHKVAPVTNMEGDRMKVRFSFDKQYKVDFPDRANWLDDHMYPIPRNTTTVFTDGSKSSSGTGVGIYFSGLIEDKSISLSSEATVFQAEIHAIRQSIICLKTLEPTDERIYICSDSQAALRALNTPRVESKQIWDCVQALNDLASDRSVTLAWVPGHSGIPGNEKADQLARAASSFPIPSPELTLPVSYSRVKSAIRSWAEKEANDYWQGIKTCRQSKQMIQAYSRRRARDMLNLDRNSLRIVTGLYTGHSVLNRHLHILGLQDSPFCQYCRGELETTFHLVAQCDYYTAARVNTWGKPYLDSSDISNITVKDLLRFTSKTGRFSALNSSQQ